MVLVFLTMAGFALKHAGMEFTLYETIIMITLSVYAIICDISG